MGWRDRVKKSFGYSEHIGERVQNLKKSEKERKEPFQTTFKHYPHNPQNPQNRKETGKKPEKLNQDQADIKSTVNNQATPEAGNLSQTPPAEPSGLGPEYDQLWSQAWALADFVDGDTAPHAARVARLPELIRMRDRLAELEQVRA